jgi:hypothetical protein
MPLFCRKFADTISSLTITAPSLTSEFTTNQTFVLFSLELSDDPSTLISGQFGLDQLTLAGCVNPQFSGSGIHYSLHCDFDPNSGEISVGISENVFEDQAGNANTDTTFVAHYGEFGFDMESNRFRNLLIKLFASSAHC